MIIIPVFYRLVNSAPYAWRRFKRRGWNGGKTLITLLALMMTIPAFAEEPTKAVTLDEAIQIALREHPRLKSANADIERERAARGEVWDGGSTSFNYSWGQS